MVQTKHLPSVEKTGKANKPFNSLFRLRFENLLSRSLDSLRLVIVMAKKMTPEEEKKKKEYYYKKKEKKAADVKKK